MSTRERLVSALGAAQAPQEMLDAAQAGYYDEFEGPLDFPIWALIRDLERAGLHGLAHQARQGAFDATREEANAWLAREGQDLLGEGA